MFQNIIPTIFVRFMIWDTIVIHNKWDLEKSVKKEVGPHQKMYVRNHS